MLRFKRFNDYFVCASIFGLLTASLAATSLNEVGNSPSKPVSIRSKDLEDIGFLKKMQLENNKAPLESNTLKPWLDYFLQQVKETHGQYLNEYKIVRDNVRSGPNLISAFSAYFSYAARISVDMETQDEGDFFSSTSVGDLYKAYLTNGGYKTTSVGAHYTNKIFEVNTSSSRQSSKIKNIKLTGEIEDYLAESYPTPLVFPLLGKSKLKLDFLLKCYFNHIFPIAIPNKKLVDKGDIEAHGIKMSPYGFAVHDLFHCANFNDSVFNALRDHCYDEIDMNTQDINPWDAVKKYPEIAVKKHQLIFDSLGKLMDLMKDESQRRNFLVANFTIFHENTEFVGGVYNKGNLFDVLDSLFIPMNPAYTDERHLGPFIPNNREDGTYPQDENTLKSIGRDILCEINNGYQDKIRDKLTRISIKKTKFGLMYEARTRCGKKFTIKVPSLYFIWKQYDDYLDLIKYANVGSTLNKSDFSTEDNQIEMIKILGQKISDRFNFIVGECVNDSKFILTKNDEGKKLAEDFEKKYQDLNKYWQSGN